MMTRPLMQEFFLFPVLATVLGPGEIAYWALTGEAFEQVGFLMPIIVPRTEYTLMDRTVQKYMEKYGLDIEDVIHRFEEKKAEWLKEQDELHLEERFAELRPSSKGCTSRCWRRLQESIRRLRSWGRPISHGLSGKWNTLRRVLPMCIKAGSTRL